MEFLCGVTCERYDSPLHAIYRHNCVYVGSLIPWRNRLIIRVDSGAANHPWMRLTKTTDQSYDLMFHLAYVLLALILVCTFPGTVILVLAFLLMHSLTLVVYVLVVVQGCVFYMCESLKFEGKSMVVMVPWQYCQLMNCEDSAMQWSPGNIILASCRSTNHVSRFLVGLALVPQLWQ